MSTEEFELIGGHLDGAWWRLPLDAWGRPPREMVVGDLSPARMAWTGEEMVAVAPVSTRYQRAQRGDRWVMAANRGPARP